MPLHHCSTICSRFHPSTFLRNQGTREGGNKSYFLKVTLAIAHSKKMLSRLGRPYTSPKEEEIKATPKSCFQHFIFRVGDIVCPLDSRMPTLLFESSFYFFPGGLRFWSSSVRPSSVIVSLEIVRLVWLDWSQSSTGPLAYSFCFSRCVLLDAMPSKKFASQQVACFIVV